MAKAVVLGKVVDRPLVGEPAQVDAALAALRARGDLVAEGACVELVDGRIAVELRYVDRTPEPRSYRAPVVAGGAVVTAGLIGVAGWLAVEWMIGHWVLIVGALIAAAVVMVALGRVGACPGIHCPGCRHH